MSDVEVKCVLCTTRVVNENGVFCNKCINFAIELNPQWVGNSVRTLGNKIKEVQKELLLTKENNNELEKKLTFLQLPVDDDPTLAEDVVIVVQEDTHQVLHADKLILSNKSAVFRRMFKTPMMEAETGIIRIDDATLPAVRAMIDFCYSAKIEFSDKVTPEEMLEVANKYDIDLLQKVCEEMMIRTIDEGNLTKRLKLASKFEVKGLQTAARQYFKEHFDSIISTVEKELRDL